MEQLDLEHAGLPGEGSRPERQRPKTAPRFKYIDRQQTNWREFAVDDLIAEDHPARAIWEFLLEQVDLTPFSAGVQSVKGWAGQSALPPELLIGLWLYAYSEGIGSAREVSRRCKSDPAFRWLCGDDAVNYHTLSDFRVQHEAALRALLVSTLAALSCAGMVKLECVAHDGTKVRAVASDNSLHRRQTIEEHLAAAQQRVREVEQDPGEGVSERQRAARRRAVEERRQRLQEASAQLKEIEKQKEKEPAAKDQQEAAKGAGKAKTEARVSETEPEARRMKLPEGGYAPAYNAQVTTDGEAGIIINAELSPIGADFPLLTPSLEQVKETFGKMPDQTLTDGGFLSRKNILDQDGRTDLIGPYDQEGCYGEAQRKRQGIAAEFAAKFFIFDAAQNRFVCPAGKQLIKQRTRRGETHTEHYYRASAEDCGACVHKAECCPTTKMRSVMRVDEHEAVRRFREKMRSESAQQAYRRRAQLAEFPFCWIKEKMGLRRFHVRGLKKARLELWWVTLAYNIKQWIRLRPGRLAAAAA